MNFLFLFVDGYVMRAGSKDDMCANRLLVPATENRVIFPGHWDPVRDPVLTCVSVRLLRLDRRCPPWLVWSELVIGARLFEGHAPSLFLVEPDRKSD